MSQALGPGLNLCRGRFFQDFSDIFQNFESAESVGQQDSEAVGMGLNPSIYLYVFSIL